MKRTTEHLDKAMRDLHMLGISYQMRKRWKRPTNTLKGCYVDQELLIKGKFKCFLI